MTAHAFRTRRSIALSALAGLALLLGTAPARADTTTVSKDGGGYEVRVTNEVGSGAVNVISVSEDASRNLIVEDSGSGVDVVAGANCSQQTADRVSCPPDSTVTATLEITTGLANDQIGLNHADKGGAGIVRTLVNGGAGADVIAGGPAPETLTGDGLTGAGTAPLANTASALHGRDIIFGNGGSDTLAGMGERDYLNPGGGATETSANSLDGGTDRDFFDLGRSLGPDQVTGGSGGDTPNVSFAGGLSLLGNDAQVGGGDTVSYASRTYTDSGTVGVVADLDGIADDGAAGEGDRIGSDVEALVGGPRDDRLTGSSGSNRLDGRGGRDTMAGLDGADVMLFRDGVADVCFVPGSGDLVDLDLADPPATVCTPKSLPLSFSTTLNASPVDETMPYLVIGSRVRARRATRALTARIRCPRSAPRACAGRLSVSRRLHTKALARRRFRARPGRTTRVTLKLSPARLAALRRAGRAVLTSVTQGTSSIGPTTSIVARRV